MDVLPDPVQVLTRTGTMLRLVQQGLADMEQSEHDRALLGFCAVAVFGRSITLALQHLRHFDKSAFDEWYEPWQREMKDDPLCRWFYERRTDILHGIAPQIAVVLASAGRDAPRPGTVTVPDRPPPDVHRGQPIQDRTMIGVCRLFAAYLEDIVESAAVVIWRVHDRHIASRSSEPGL